ncbi:MAG: Cna B-type domain-containing protein [Defluviitaleaceae bacterium]|nr:Cna B-type domain-containing protein [Defluviitaleaceae bacterium]
MIFVFKSFLRKYRWAILALFVLTATAAGVFAFADPPEPTTEVRFNVRSSTLANQATRDSVFVLYEQDTTENTWVQRPGYITQQAPGSFIDLIDLSHDSQYKLVQIAASYLHYLPGGYWIIHVSDTGAIDIVSHDNDYDFALSGGVWSVENTGRTHRDITITHVWAQCVLDAGLATDEVVVRLHTEWPEYTARGYAFLNAGNNWTHTFYDLPAHDPVSGGLITYAIAPASWSNHPFTIERSGVNWPWTDIVSGSNHVTWTSSRLMQRMAISVFDDEMNRLENVLFAIERFHNGEWIRTGATYTSNEWGWAHPYICSQSIMTGQPYRAVVIDAPEGFILPTGALNFVSHNAVHIILEAYGDIDFRYLSQVGKGGGQGLILHRDTQTRDITVQKTWNTWGSDITYDELIAKTVDVVLYANGVRIQGPITIRRITTYCCIAWGADWGVDRCGVYRWIHTFYNLPVYDAHGVAINYEVREINVPHNFIPYYWFQGSDNISITNSYYRMDFRFRKTGRDGAWLPGAVFSVYARVYVPGTGYTYVFNQTATSDNDGIVRLTRLRRDAVYRLVETQAPAGYETPDGYWLLTINPRGLVTITEHGDAPAFGSYGKGSPYVGNVPTTTPPTTTPAETTPQQTTPAETTPQQTTPTETTPQQTTPTETTPQQTTPTETTPQQTTPTETTPQQTTPTETTPQQTTPTETTPQQTTPAETTPQQTTPTETTPQQTTPAETTPQQTTPTETTPQQTTPTETTPQQTTPAETTPQQTTPAETTPQQTTPAETTPQQTTPTETTPQQTTPTETTPQQTTPQQTTPQQTTPQQTTPHQTWPQQTTPPLTSPPTQPTTDPPTRVITFPPPTTTPTATTPTPTTPTATTPAATTTPAVTTPTPTAPVTAPTTPTPTTPTPTPPTPGPGNHLRPNGNGYLELDDNNVPQGNWVWRESNGWFFIPDGNIPMGRMPQTGIPGTVWITVAINLMAVGALSTLIIKKRKAARLK